MSGLPPLGFPLASEAATASPAGSASPSGPQILIPDACVGVKWYVPESDALDVYRLLRTVPITVHATEGLLEDAIRHGVRYRRPVYDSLYLTLAVARGGRVVTADGRLHRGVDGGPLDHLVLWVTDPL